MDWINVTFWLVGTLVVVLGPIILVHELGHFIFAKLAGVRVEEFGVGLPPRLLKLRQGRGYLEIGTARATIPPGFRLPPGLEVGAHVDAAVHRRNDGTHVLCSLTVADSPADCPGDTSETTEELHLRGALTVLEPGTLYSLNLLPMGAFVKMTGEEDPSDLRSLAAQPKRWRVAVLAAGPVINIIVAIMLLVGAYVSGYPEKWVVEVTHMEPGSAAEGAGLDLRDVILSAGGERIEGESPEDGQNQLRTIIRAAPEQSIELTISRGEEILTLMAVPKRTSEGYGLLGILMSPWPDRSALHRYHLPEALTASIRDIISVTMMTVQVPVRLIQGDVTPQEVRPTSMVGISSVLAFSLQQSIEWGMAFPVLQTASLISLALGLTNLLPLPAFDGGRIFFVLIEAVRGRRISPKREAIVHFVGLMILVSLMALVMFQDLINPIIPWSLLK
jgi:regulator of sigma E protease